MKEFMVVSILEWQTRVFELKKFYLTTDAASAIDLARRNLECSLPASHTFEIEGAYA